MVRKKVNTPSLEAEFKSLKYITSCFAFSTCDLKARKEINFYKRSWQSTDMCDSCNAVLPNKKARLRHHLAFCNFRSDAPHRCTLISHEAYLASAGPMVSPLSQKKNMTPIATQCSHAVEKHCEDPRQLGCGLARSTGKFQLVECIL